MAFDPDMKPHASRNPRFQVDQLKFSELRQLPCSSIPKTLHKLRNLERKCFASDEVYPFDDNILRKQNMLVLVGMSDNTELHDLVTYAVCVRWHRQLLLHKICVAPAYRRAGVGSHMLQAIVERACRWSCRGIDLWGKPSSKVPLFEA